MTNSSATPSGRPDAVWRKSHLEVRQNRGASERHDASGDLLILTSSWERRSVEISRINHGQYARAAVLMFAEEGTSGRRAEHDALLTRLANEHAFGVIVNAD